MNYVVTQVAKPKENKVPQMQGKAVKDVEDAMNVYVKNAIVSLASAKMTTPDAVCMLNCNFEISDELRRVAEAADVEIHHVPFGQYESNEKFPWAITQYKFDSLHYTLNLMNDEDCMILLDTDTVCIRCLDEIFREAKTDSLIMYIADHSYIHKRRQEMIQNYRKMFGTEKDNLVLYGGEFYAGTKKVLEELLEICGKVIDVAREKLTDEDLWDDEHVLAIAIEEFWNQKVYSAGAYISRYWTNKFYKVSTDYYYDAVNIWHLPAEKSYGMIVLYEYFEKHHCFPDVKKMAKIMGLPGTKYKGLSYYRLKMRLRYKMKR